ncbi:MAG: helix-turn-helix transcriptional regulator [Spirochaetota bacterium]|nr:helix-turn-helix transcriptional regulator [Spirochaetota bacterium]HPV96740.1 helix-turn-helix transcriptional regulator [Spirochaetota bacterium]
MIAGYGKRIVELRRLKGLSQGQLAAMMGITQASLSALEHSVFPSLARIQQICDLLDYPVWQFFYDDRKEVS